MRARADHIRRGARRRRALPPPRVPPAAPRGSEVERATLRRGGHCTSRFRSVPWPWPVHANVTPAGIIREGEAGIAEGPRVRTAALTATVRAGRDTGAACLPFEPSRMWAREGRRGRYSTSTMTTDDASPSLRRACAATRPSRTTATTYGSVTQSSSGSPSTFRRRSVRTTCRPSTTRPRNYRRRSSPPRGNSVAAAFCDRAYTTRRHRSPTPARAGWATP